MIEAEEAERVARRLLEEYVEKKILEWSGVSCHFKNLAGTPVYEVIGKITCLIKKRRFLLGRRVEKWDFVVKIHAEKGKPLSWRLRT